MPGPYFQVRPAYASELPLFACPVRASLGVLGRKWALTVLRDVAHRSNVRFSDILHHNPGLTPRALSLSLKELQAQGLIVRVPVDPARREFFYELTPRGEDTIPVLTALIAFSIKHMPEAIFTDGRPRTLDEVNPNSQTAMLGDLAAYARAGEGRPQLLRSDAPARVDHPAGSKSASREPDGSTRTVLVP